MIGLLVVVVYLAAVLCAARAFYGYWRARRIEENYTSYVPMDSQKAVDCYYRYDRSEVMVGWLVAAFFWPFTLLMWCVVRFVSHNPPYSRIEMEAERDSQVQRIRELEAELGIADKRGRS